MTNGAKDEELDAWQAEWASLGQTESFAKAIVERAARDGRKLRLAAASEVLAVLFSMALSIGLVVRSHGALPVVVIVVIIQLFSGVWLAHYFAERRALFAAEGNDLAGFVTLTRQRLETARRWTVFARRWMQVLGLIVVPWSGWMAFVNAPVYRAEPWRAVVGFGAALVIFAGAYAWLARKARTTVREQAALEREIADAELG